MHSGNRSSAHSGWFLGLSLAVAATVLPASKAAAERWQYCVSNSSSTHGLYTNDVYYSEQCSGSDRKCISREHFFSFVDGSAGIPIPTACTTHLTVDFDADRVPRTATLKGNASADAGDINGLAPSLFGNKNAMEIDVDLSLAGGHLCAPGTDSLVWPGKWGKTIKYSNATAATTPPKVPLAFNWPSDEPLQYKWGCFSTVSGVFGEPPATQPPQDMYQVVSGTVTPGYVIQFGVGANAVTQNHPGGLAKFPVSVAGSNKTWELGMTLSAPRRMGPTAQHDTFVTQQGVPITICAEGTEGSCATSTDGETGLLANDTTASPRYISAFTPPAAAQGTLVASQSGLAYTSFLFTPKAGFNGDATFTYTVTDGDGSSTATVTITVVKKFALDDCVCKTIGVDGSCLEQDRNGDALECHVDLYGDGDKTYFIEFTNEDNLKGLLDLDFRYDIPDPRPHCGGTQWLNRLPNTVTGRGYPPNVSYEIRATGTAAPYGLEVKLKDVLDPAKNSGSIQIPWYMCGIPAAETNLPFIRLVSLKADFLATSDNADFRDVVNSVVRHYADEGTGTGTGSQNPQYACTPDVANADPGDPVVAWLPRAEEIPYMATVSPSQDAIPQPAPRVVRDITAGCGSTRGGTSTRSYLLSNLIYFNGQHALPAAGAALTEDQLRSIILAELDALEATLQQPARAFGTFVPGVDDPAAQLAAPYEGLKRSSCVDADQNVVSNIWPKPGDTTGNSLLIQQVRTAFLAKDYASAISKLQQKLLKELEPVDDSNKGGGLFYAFDTCYYRDPDIARYEVNLVEDPMPLCPKGAICNLIDYPALEPVSFGSSELKYPPYGYGYIPRNFRGDLQAQVEHIIWNIEQKLIPITPTP